MNSGFQLRTSSGVTVKGEDIRWDVAKPVRHQTLTLASAGSSPAIPAKLPTGTASQEAVLFALSGTKG